MNIQKKGIKNTSEKKARNNILRKENERGNNKKKMVCKRNKI